MKSELYAELDDAARELASGVRSSATHTMEQKEAAKTRPCRAVRDSRAALVRAITHAPAQDLVG